MYYLLPLEVQRIIVRELLHRYFSYFHFTGQPSCAKSPVFAPVIKSILQMLQNRKNSVSRVAFQSYDFRGLNKAKFKLSNESFGVAFS